jgi:hypothetical protein
MKDVPALDLDALSYIIQRDEDIVFFVMLEDLRSNTLFLNLLVRLFLEGDNQIKGGNLCPDKRFWNWKMHLLLLLLV